MKTAIPDNMFYAHMSEGHYNRKGHPLEGYLLSEDGMFPVLVRTCC